MAKRIEKKFYIRIYIIKFELYNKYPKNKKMINKLKEIYVYYEIDAMLVLKDVLYHEWKDNLKDS